MGLQKSPEPATGETVASERPARSWLNSPGTWRAFMIADAAFMAIFGGYLGKTIYTHWKAPPAVSTQTEVKKTKSDVPAKTPPKPPETSPEPAKAVESAPPASATPMPPAEPAKPAETHKPAEVKSSAAPKTSAKPAEPAKPLPKPSMISAQPAPRPAPNAQAAPKAAAKAAVPTDTPAPAAGSSVRALPVEFRLHAPSAKSVALVGAFLVKGGRKDMSAGSDGLWTLTVYLKPGSFRYSFLVDGKKTLDPENPSVARGASVLDLQAKQ